MTGQLHLISGHGDATLAKYKWVVHGTSNAQDVVSILDSGFKYIEGRPTFSTNLVHAYDWTVNPDKQAQSYGNGYQEGEPGRVVMFAIPATSHLGYGVFTSATIDRTLKHVSGAPLRYAAARKQVALYSRTDTEGARLEIEKSVAEGVILQEQARKVMEPGLILGSFMPGEHLASVVRRLGGLAHELQTIDFAESTRTLLELFQPGARIDPSEGLTRILQGTVESIVISRLRMMRWQGLALIGYSFSEGRQPIQIKALGSKEEHLQRAEEYAKKVAASELLSGELGWLKQYAADRLEIIKVELEGLKT